jgi:hypothetical protein
MIRPELPSSLSPVLGRSAETDGPEAEASPPPAARLPLALRDGIRAAWDRLGLVIAVSVTWTALLFIPLSIGYWLPSTLPVPVRYAVILLTAAWIGAAPTAGAFAVAQRVAAQREATYADFWREGLQWFWPALRLSLLHQVVLGLIAINLRFYLLLGSLAGKIGCLLCLYALLFFLMMAVYHWPLLAAQESGIFDEPGRRAKRGALAVMRRAFFLAMGRPFYSLGLLTVLLLISALLFATLALPALLWIGTMAMLAAAANRALLIQYGVLPAPPQEEPIPDEKFRL